MTIDTKPKPLRADAQRNRAALVKAAEEAFAANGSDASVNDIARRAGVGVGTLYRHFSSRSDLVIEVAEKIMSGVADRAFARETDVDPGGAVKAWMLDLLASARYHCGAQVWEMLATVADDRRISAGKARMREAGQRLIDRAIAAGRMQAGTTSADLARFVFGIGVASEEPGATRLIDPGDEVHASAERMIDIVLAGLRP
jgi:AcrR family transcriptional regulator